MNITIETKAGKFVMKGEEFVEAFGQYLTEIGWLGSSVASSKFAARKFLSTYEEEVKTEGERSPKTPLDLGRPDCTCSTCFSHYHRS